MVNSLFALIISLLLSSFLFGQDASTHAAFNDAVTAVKGGNYIDALSGFRRAQTKAELSNAATDYLAKIHFNIGVCLYKLDRTADAIPEYREAIRLDGSYEKAHYSLGMAELAENNLDKAEAAFRTVLRLNNKNGEAWFDLAFVQIAKKDYDSARQAFENALKFNTVDAAISHNNLGVLAAIRGDIDKAEAEFERALDRSDGKLPAARSNLEHCRRIKGNSELIAKLELGYR
ncbi:MAG TPA: tetratricopeptide repeat protein [Pyrinomonadaceae bacterium]|nr:tetratricopeptide repeat protein [Pyrinomonadaceae bacterium]